MSASPWSTQSCVPHRQFAWSKPPGLPCRRSRRQSNTHATRTGFPNAIQLARLRTPPQPAGKWSKPPGLPCRRSRRQSDTIPNGTGVPTPSSPHDCALHLKPPPLFHLRVLRVLCGLPSPCSPWFVFSVFSVFSVVCFFRALHVVSDVGQAFQPAAGFRAGLGALYPLPSFPPNHAAPVEQAARLAMPAVTPAEPHNPDLCGSSKRHPARTPPHSTSTRPLFSISVFFVFSVVCLLRVLCGLPSPCSLWFAFSVFSVVCFFRALHVVSVVGQAFQPAAGFRAGLGALYPLPSFSPNHAAPVEQAARLAMPAVTPAEPHTRHTYGVSERHPARTTARSTSTRPLFSISVFSVFSVVCLLRVLCGLLFPCPPCRVRCGAGFPAGLGPLYPPPSESA